MNKVKEWLASKEPRERLILITGVIFLCLLLMYSIIVQPMISGLNKRELMLEGQRETLAWMKQSAEEIKALKKFSTPKAGNGSKAYLLSTVDRPAKAANLREVSHRVEPQGDNQVQ